MVSYSHRQNVCRAAEMESKFHKQLFIFSAHSLFPWRAEWHGLRQINTHIHKYERLRDMEVEPTFMSVRCEKSGEPVEKQNKQTQAQGQELAHSSGFLSNNVSWFFACKQTMPLDLMCVRAHSIPALGLQSGMESWHAVLGPEIQGLL